MRKLFLFCFFAALAGAQVVTSPQYGGGTVSCSGEIDSGCSTGFGISSGSVHASAKVRGANSGGRPIAATQANYNELGYAWGGMTGGGFGPIRSASWPSCITRIQPIRSLTTPAAISAALTASAKGSAPCPTFRANPGSIPPGWKGGWRNTIIPALSKAVVSSSRNRIASLSLITWTMRTRVLKSKSAFSMMATCSFVTCLSMRLASSRTLARFASAAICSALAARSLVSDIALLLSSRSAVSTLEARYSINSSPATPKNTSNSPRSWSWSMWGLMEAYRGAGENLDNWAKRPTPNPNTTVEMYPRSHRDRRSDHSSNPLIISLGVFGIPRRTRRSFGLIEGVIWGLGALLVFVIVRWW